MGHGNSRSAVANISFYFWSVDSRFKLDGNTLSALLSLRLGFQETRPAPRPPYHHPWGDKPPEKFPGHPWTPPGPAQRRAQQAAVGFSSTPFCSFSSQILLWERELSLYLRQVDGSDFCNMKITPHSWLGISEMDIWEIPLWNGFSCWNFFTGQVSSSGFCEIPCLRLFLACPHPRLCEGRRSPEGALCSVF